MTADSDAAKGTAAAHRLGSADPAGQQTDRLDFDVGQPSRESVLTGGPRPARDTTARDGTARDGTARDGITRIATAALPPAGDAVAVAAAACLTWHADLVAVGYAAAVLVAMLWLGQYRYRIGLRVSDQVARIAAAAIVPAPILMFGLSTGRALMTAGYAAAFVAVSRGLVYRGIRLVRSRGWLTDNAVIVGADDLAVQIADLLREHPEIGLAPQGFVDQCANDHDRRLPILAGLPDLPATITEVDVRRVIVCSPADGDTVVAQVLRACRRLPVTIHIVPRLHSLSVAVPRAVVDDLHGIPLVRVRRTPTASLRLKRAFDVVGAALLLVVTGPLLLALAAVIRLRCGGPVIFRQLRVTGPGRVAHVLKLRTLAEHATPIRDGALPTTSRHGLAGGCARHTSMNFRNW